MAGSDLKHTLIDQVASYALDPLGFVLFAFPWAEPGTELANLTGPRDWQRELLAELGRRLRDSVLCGSLPPTGPVLPQQLRSVFLRAGGGTIFVAGVD